MYLYTRYIYIYNIRYILGKMRSPSIHLRRGSAAVLPAPAACPDPAPRAAARGRRLRLRKHGGEKTRKNDGFP